MRTSQGHILRVTDQQRAQHTFLKMSSTPNFQRSSKNRWAYSTWDCLSPSPETCEYHKMASTKCILIVPCIKSYVEALLLAASIQKRNLVLRMQS